MNKAIEQNSHAYRWIILLIIFLTHITLNLLIFQIGGWQAGSSCLTASTQSICDGSDDSI
jgi:hypothetical protein